MRGEELLKALNDVDLEMVEKAEAYKADVGSHKGYLWRRTIKWAVIMVVFVVAVLVISDKEILQRKDEQAKQVISVPLYTKSDETCKVYYLIAEEVEKSETEDYGFLYIDSGGDVFQLNLSAIKGFSDSINGYKKGKVNTSQRLMEAFSVAQKKIETGEAKEGEIRYLVSIDINEAAMEDVAFEGNMESYQSVNDEIMKAEYERLTEEFGYELTWIPKGGYQVAEDYWYYLENGGIYGILTEKEIKEFPVKEEYAYVFWLTCYESLEYTKCVYKEVCEQAELYRAQQIALEALRQLEVEK